VKKQFDIYSKFAKTDINGLLNAFPNEASIRLKANEFRSGWIENKGKNEFVFHPFPVQAQWAPANAIIINDFNKDKHTDILLAGNDFCMHPYIGRYDAMNGLLLKGNASQSFQPLSIAESGFFVPGHARYMVHFPYGNITAVAVAQNRGRMKFYEVR
jgi:hypothetical protein